MLSTRSSSRLLSTTPQRAGTTEAGGVWWRPAVSPPAAVTVAQLQETIIEKELAVAQLLAQVEALQAEIKDAEAGFNRAKRLQHDQECMARQLACES